MSQGLFANQYGHHRQPIKMIVKLRFVCLFVCFYFHADTFLLQEVPPLVPTPRPPRPLQLAKTSNIPSSILSLRLSSDHCTPSSVYDEWMGLNDFSPDADPTRPSGGIKLLEERYKKEWRKTWTAQQEKVLSHLRVIATYILHCIDQDQGDVQCVLQQLDKEAQASGVTSLYGLEMFIKRLRKNEGTVKERPWNRTVLI